MPAGFWDRMNLKKSLYTQDEVDKLVRKNTVLNSALGYTISENTVYAVLDELKEFKAGVITWKLRKKIDDIKKRLRCRAK